MARTALPRYTADVVVRVELAAEDEADAGRRAAELIVGTIEPRLIRALRNAGGRTARLAGIVRLDLPRRVAGS